MLLAALQQVEKFYGDQTVLKDANLEVRGGSRIALIGRNGSGKSTMLRLLMRQESPDSGKVYLREGVTIAMLEQDPSFEEFTTITELADKAFVEIEVIEAELKRLEDAGLDKPEIYDEWEKVHEVFERRGGYERRSRRDAVLYSLGFRGREEELVKHLSGGEKTRLGLAKLLMAQPDVLLLDEPTNHLDMEMREWLEGYLGRYPGGVLLVSHDRLFLDKACSQTAEISLAKLRNYDGNPTKYREARIEQLRLEEATRQNQQKAYDKLEASATQMKKWARQNAKLHRRAKSMEKRLARLGDQMIGDADMIERTTRFSFECEESGDIVLQAKNLSKRFDKQLFEDVDFTMRRGERIALVGSNGAGKSTFLKTIMGEIASDDPAAELLFGSRVRVGYYDQELKGVDPELTLADELLRMVGDIEAHNMLGNFLFPYDAQFKKIKDLSGGERARLALLKLTLGQYNFLVLDEPTNHLDVEMIEALEEALDYFEGTLLVVSHDRRFIAETTDLIWDLRDGEWIDYPGDWEYYQFKRKQIEDNQRNNAKDKKKQKALESQEKIEQVKTPSKWQLERDIETLETEIAELEEQLEEVNGKLQNPALLSHQELADVAQKHGDLDTALIEKMQAWEDSSEMLAAKS